MATTQIIAEPGVPQILMTREFDAPRELVFRAHVDPELLERAVDVSEVRHVDDGEWADGPGGPWNSFIFFEDPDGNGWAVQQKPGSDD